MTIRERVFETAKIEPVRVDDVPGFGTVWLRPYPEGLRILRRESLERSTGVPSSWRAQRMIDLVVNEDGSPAFDQHDLESLMELDSVKLDGIALAISAFLTEEGKKKADG